MENDKKHSITMYHLNSLTKTINGIIYEYPEAPPTYLRKSLKQRLRVISRINNFPTCGGLPNEIGFEYNGATYYFTCYKIEKDGKVIAGTDYAKFGKYCNGGVK